MKNAIIFLLLAIAANAFSQVETTAGKGVNPVATPPAVNPPPSTVRAVVIGISDYQSPQIPDLQFANRDAEAFANWLKSPAGGKVPEENIRVLLDEKAKNAQIVADLDGLAEDIQPGELAVIYFSGHGDVETKTRNQFGFLLAWDSPPTNYKAGAYPLIFLQDIISTISDKKAQVVVITDACHAGKLAGSQIGGTQATAQTLATQFANEVKIMSCQPNELALEGKQWGGGRGVFSYYLIRGLTGLADKNADASVNLHEIDRFLGDIVPTQTAPHPQIPMVVGNKQTPISKVDAATLAALLKDEINFEGTAGRFLVDGFLEETDSLLRLRYHEFETALQSGELLRADSGRASADEIFQQLSKEENLRPLHGLMRRNLAAALQNEPQQAINALLESDPYESNHWNYNPKKYADYPAQLARAIELLGDKHYMKNTLLSKKIFFEAFLLVRSMTDETMPKTTRDNIKNEAKKQFLEAVKLEPMAAYIFYTIGQLHAWESPAQTDSLVKYMQTAIELAPTWILPFVDIATEWTASFDNMDESDRWLTAALQIKPESYMLQERLSWLRQWQNRTEESLEISKKMMAEKPDLFNAYATAGVTCLMRKEYNEAEKYFLKAMELDKNPNGNWAFQYVIVFLGNTRRMQEVFDWCDKYLSDPAIEVFNKSTFLCYINTVSFLTRHLDQLEKYADLMGKMDVIGPHSTAASMAKGQAKFLRGETEIGLALMEEVSLRDSFNGSYQMTFFEHKARAVAKQGKPAQADSLFQKAINYKNRALALTTRTDRTLESARFHYGKFLLDQNRDAEALAQFQIGLEEEPLGYFPHLGMALFAAKKKDKTAALDWLERSLDNWFPLPEMILEEPLFKKIRKTRRFSELMKKHFPQQQRH